MKLQVYPFHEAAGCKQMSKKIYDKDGKWVATETKGAFGAAVIKDRDGKVQNYLGKDALGNSVVQDKDGKVQAYRGQDALGNQILRDRDGKKSAYLGKDSSGNSVFRDTDGKITGYYDLGGNGKGGFFSTEKPSSNKGSSPSHSGWFQNPAGSSKPNSAYSDNSNHDPYTASINAAAERAANAPVYISPQERRLYKKDSSLFNWGLVFYGLPILYTLATLFIPSLPLSFTVMLTILTAGVFLGACFTSASDTAFEVIEVLVAVGIPSLFYVLRVGVCIGTHIDMRSDLLYSLLLKIGRMKAVYLGGPILFLIADLLGILLGKQWEKRIRKKMLSANAPTKLAFHELAGKHISVWLSAFSGLLFTMLAMLLWYIVLHWAMIEMFIPLLGRILPSAEDYFSNSLVQGVLITLIGTAAALPIAKKFLHFSHKIYPPKSGARYITIGLISLLLAVLFFIGWRNGTVPLIPASIQYRVGFDAWLSVAYGMAVYAWKFIASGLRLQNNSKHQ